MYAFCFISNTFVSNIRLKLTKNQTKVMEHPEAKLLLFENYSLSTSMLSSKTNMRYPKKCAKHKCACFNEIMWLIIMKIRLKMKDGSHRCDINRTRSRHGHKYTKNKMCLSMMMVMCSKQHVSNIGSWIHEKVQQHWGLVEKKTFLIKKHVFEKCTMKYVSHWESIVLYQSRAPKPTMKVIIIEIKEITT